MPTRELSFSPTSIEDDGYGRRFMLGLHSGRLVFGFDDKHFGRNFYVTATFDFGQMGEETTHVTADTVGELIDFMNDDHDLGYFLESL